jgi:hypothetical protein
MAFGPLNRTMPIAPSPGGVEIAAMVSSGFLDVTGHALALPANAFALRFHVHFIRHLRFDWRLAASTALPAPAALG